MYELTDKVKSFAVENDFTLTMSKVAYKWGTMLTPFCIFADEYQKAHNVIDITEFGGMVDSNKTLVDELYEQRVKDLAESGIHLPANADIEVMKKVLLFQYFITISVCYVEVEKWKTTNGVQQKSYDKMLVTRNPEIMGAWMGCSGGEMNAKYSARIKSSPFELKDGIVRFVKLNQSSKGNSITVPRTTVSCDKVRFYPLFMLYAFTEGFKTKLQNRVLKFTFLKDNHTEREMYTTLSREILLRFYNDRQFVEQMLGGVDINTVKQGGMMLSSKIHRGYIKVPEVGSSIYDATGVRSLNLARVLKIEEVNEADVDTTYINVSLNSVVQNFQDCLEYCGKNNPDALPVIYEQVMEKKPDESYSVATMISNMCEHASKNEIILSTTYQRYLHKYMVENPQYFPTYTGVPVKASSTSGNYGVEQMDF